VETKHASTQRCNCRWYRTEYRWKLGDQSGCIRPWCACAHTVKQCARASPVATAAQVQHENSSGRPSPTCIGESRASRGNRNTQTRSVHGSTSSDGEPLSDEQTGAESAREQRQSAQTYGSSDRRTVPTGAYSRVEVSLGGRNYATKPLLIFDSNRNFSYLPIWHAQCL